MLAHPSMPLGVRTRSQDPSWFLVTSPLCHTSVPSMRHSCTSAAVDAAARTFRQSPC